MTTAFSLCSHRPDFPLQAAKAEEPTYITFDVVRGWMCKTADIWVPIEELSLRSLQRIALSIEAHGSCILVRGVESTIPAASDLTVGVHTFAAFLPSLFLLIAGLEADRDELEGATEDVK